MKKYRPILYITLLFTSVLFLTGCSHAALLNPKGTIAASESKILIWSTVVMLCVVIPVIILSIIFALRYHEKNKHAKYSPEFVNSHLLEGIWWAIPCVIIIILAITTWVTSHTLNPYRPLVSDKKPVTIDVVALDWKWLFIYPSQHIATVNFMEIPKNTPINLYITAAAPMNSLEIPQLAGQIYAMTGMQTQLHIDATEVGDYKGFSANYSGNGFAGMKFIVRAATDANYQAWVKSVQKAPMKLTFDAYNKLAKPSSNNKVTYYSHPANDLFHQIIMKYMSPAKSPIA